MKVEVRGEGCKKCDKNVTYGWASGEMSSYLLRFAADWRAKVDRRQPKPGNRERRLVGGSHT
jgi:hypothetical protein